MKVRVISCRAFPEVGQHRDNVDVGQPKLNHFEEKYVVEERRKAPNWLTVQ